VIKNLLDWGIYGCPCCQSEEFSVNDLSFACSICGYTEEAIEDED
jgi:ferredoxin-thioredoxin reductase catalytic subunit